MNLLKFLENHLRGWIPEERSFKNGFSGENQGVKKPIDQRSNIENRFISREAIRAARMFGIANIIMGSVFFYLIISYFASPNSVSYELTTVLLIALMVSWLSINYLLIRNYKKQTQTTTGVV